MKKKDDLRCALYVKGFPDRMSKVQLAEKFSEIAEVVRVDIHMNKHQKQAFVHLKNE